MIRDYVNYNKKRQRPRYRGLLWLFLFFCAVLVGVGFYVQRISFSRLKEWAIFQTSTYFSQVLHPKQKNQALTKKLSSNTQETVKPIHFDFYDELPKTSLDFSSADLPSLSSAETASSYILQLSEFHSLEAANRYRAALTAAGLTVELVRSQMDKEVVYRLQQGPYHSLEQLKLAKKRLMERGIACEVHKLSPYKDK